MYLIAIIFQSIMVMKLSISRLTDHRVQVGVVLHRRSLCVSVISYRVLVIPGKRFAGGISTTTANVWVSVAGQLRDSDRKWLPRNCYDFTFEV